MSSLATERNVLEEGLNIIKRAKLEFASPVNEMYDALQRQYTQVRTIKLQGKAQDYVKKVLHDSKFFCILTKLITQAIGQSKTAKQQTANIHRVHSWYTANLHKLHLAEQPAFRGGTPSSSSSIRRIDQVPSSKYSGRIRSSSSIRKASIISSEAATEHLETSEHGKSEEVESVPTRPKSVTWREPRLNDEKEGSEKGEAKRESVYASDTSSPEPSKPLDMVHSISGRSTPYYNLVDDDSYIDTVLSSNLIEGTTPRRNSPVGRTFTPVVNEYVEQIQREVNKVQGHPSDLYPELFTPHIVNAIINENQDNQPIGRVVSADRGSRLGGQSTEQFFQMAESYRPNSVKKFTSLRRRKEQKPRPKSSISIYNSRPSTATQESKSLHMKDVVSLVDFASAEISYEKESGLRATLNRPKDTPPSISQQQIEALPTSVPEESSTLAILPVESPGSPTTSQSHTIVDWRGQVTPNCSDSQQEIFKSHSYARGCARLQGAKGRSVGSASAGYRPKTAPVTLLSKVKAEQSSNTENERIPQAASNTLFELDSKTTKSLLTISNIKTTPPRRHHSETSPEHYNGNFYLEYLQSNYAVAPSNVYEYNSYPYEYEPLPKSYPFMEEEGEARRSPSPQHVEYLTIVNSIAPDLDRIRNNTKHEARVERANTPASSVKTKDSSLPIGDDPAAIHMAAQTQNDAEQISFAKNDSPDKSTGDVEESFQSRKQSSRMKLVKSLVPSPMFQFSAYPTPHGNVLRSRSPGRQRTISTKDNHSTGLEKAVTAISFDPPFNPENFKKPKEKTKSAGRLRMSTDKSVSNTLVQPIRSAPSIPSVYNAYGCRSPRLNRAHPFSGEHDRSAHRQLNPQEYLKKVHGMRAEDVYIDDNKKTGSEELAICLDVRPMSSRLDIRPTSGDLALTYERDRIHTPIEQLCPSPAFITESNEGDAPGYPSEHGSYSHRPKSSLSTASRPVSSRPIPQYMKTESWEKTDADTERLREAAAAVSIQKIFRGYVSRKVYLNLRGDYRAEQENKRLSAVRIQRSWRQHRGRLNQIYTKPSVSPETLQWAKEFKTLQQQSKVGRQAKRESETKIVRKQERDSKERLSTIGPHVEVYSAYHPDTAGASKKDIEKAVVVIQKHVRGMQSRQYLGVLKEKAKDHASSWGEWVNYYKRFLKRILHRRGVDKPDIQINLEQMKKFMSQKKRYESVFDRRAFGGELEEDEIVQFFKECDLMPANHEIEHAIDLVFKGKPRSKKTTFKKREVLDIVFEIYKPEGTGISNDRKSTWLHPIVDGEDAMKMLGSDMVEPTPLGPCIQLVANSMRERKERAEEEERLRILANQRENRKAQISNLTDEGDENLDTQATSSETVEGKGHVKIFSSEPLIAPGPE